MKNTILITGLTLASVTGWSIVVLQQGKIQIAKAEAADWKARVQSANADLLSARSANDPGGVLIPKGTIVESNDGLKTFRINSIPRETNYRGRE